ncbi:MAG: L,D-transpeptidase family protein [Candidatus Pacebacteria bacterium]|nr:L,D-transpeptidase family protein [Candidatus Paceibacterota bacterium]
MYNVESSSRRFYAVRHDEENTSVNQGSLIPSGHFSYSPSITVGGVAPSSPAWRISYPPRRSVAMVALLVLAVAFTSWATLDGRELLATVSTPTSAPQVTIEHPSTGEQTPIHYGVNVTFSEPNFFDEALKSFVAEGQTFIEANLSTMQIRFYEEGELKLEVPILSKGKKGSWWETPAGLYEVTFKKENHFSSFGQVNMPWNMGFQGNFFIHGWPKYPGGEPVPEGYSGGCIRLSDEDAKALYDLVSVETPILVYEERAAASEFVYEPKIPELNTPHYLIADIESSTVLASSDLNAVAPIASITKLMTALIAAEFLNLDTSVNVTAPTFVQSLIPRLGERNRVSMYSLLQLLLVESSNEASEVIAAQLGRQVFIEHMNEKAKAIGMENTVFADPSGLSNDNVSTIRDLLRLLQYLHQNRRFILDLTHDQNLPTSYTSGEFGELVNFNVLKDSDNFLGGKIGETLAAGQTSATLHTLKVKGEERIIAIIILGSESRNDDVMQLLNYAEERFSY